MNRAQTRELPGNHPFVVQQGFVDGLTKQWNASAQHFCARIHSLIAAHDIPMIKSHFNYHGYGHLEQYIQHVYHLRILLSTLTIALTVC